MQKKTNINKKRVLIALVIIFIITIPVLSFYNRDIEQPGKTIFDLTPDEGATKGSLDSKSTEEVIADLNKKVEDGMINISMNTMPVYENGKAQGSLFIINDKTNKYPQIVEIYRNDTEELIYRSGGIPVGSKIEYAKLSTVLDKGTYDCVAYFNAIEPETNELVGKAGANITIVVEN